MDIIDGQTPPSEQRDRTLTRLRRAFPDEADPEDAALRAVRAPDRAMTARARHPDAQAALRAAVGERESAEALLHAAQADVAEIAVALGLEAVDVPDLAVLRKIATTEMEIATTKGRIDKIEAALMEGDALLAQIGETGEGALDRARMRARPEALRTADRARLAAELTTAETALDDALKARDLLEPALIARFGSLADVPGAIARLGTP